MHKNNNLPCPFRAALIGLIMFLLFFIFSCTLAMGVSMPRKITVVSRIEQEEKRIEKYQERISYWSEKLEKSADTMRRLALNRLDELEKAAGSIETEKEGLNRFIKPDTVGGDFGAQE